MGTDYLQLFDRRTAELVLQAGAPDLLALVDLHGRRNAPSIWHSYWDQTQQRLIDFDSGLSDIQRLQTQLDHGTPLHEIKEKFLRGICTMQEMLSLDYWGCYVEVFPNDPPGALSWERFVASFSGTTGQNEDSGTYLLTIENVAAILRNLYAHKDDLRIMKDEGIKTLETWHAVCSRDPRFCVLYQIDF
jgi:hypothetical protein